MKTFNWEAGLSVGVLEMDDQHKVLIDKINLLVDGLNTKSPKCLELFTDLAGFVVKHFQEEEALMESKKYEGITTHKIIHKTLLEQVGEYGKELQAGTLVPEKLVNFLKLWLTSHIKGIDMKYGQAFGSLKKVG